MAHWLLYRIFMIVSSSENDIRNSGLIQKHFMYVIHGHTVDTIQSLGVAFPDDELLEYIKLFQEQSDIDCKLREASTMKRSGVSTEKGRAQVDRHPNS